MFDATSEQVFAQAALAYYEFSAPATLTLINLSENATFRVDIADGQRFVLRVHRPGYHSHRAIASEIAWMVALRHDGYALTPQPVAGRNGKILQTVTLAPSQQRFVVMTLWEAGREPVMTDKLVPAFHQLGAITAQMHRHARLWQRPTDFMRFRWDFATTLGEETPHWGRWRDGLGLTPELTQLFTRTVEVIRKRLGNYGQAPQQFGLIHGDTRLANLLIDGDTIKILDFDDCGFGWFMYDAATPFSFHEHEAKVPELMAAWAAGYRQHAELSMADEAEIPTFMMLRRILLVAWVASHRTVPFARELGAHFTYSSAPLCEAFLSANS